MAGQTHSSLREALKLEDFPTSRKDLYCIVGDIQIEAKGGQVPARLALDRIKCEWFETELDAVKAISAAARKVDCEEVFHTGFRTNA